MATNNNISVDQWFFKERKELLANIRQTNKAKEELEEREKFISFTERLCVRCSLSWIPTCTTLLLLHRVLLRWPPIPLPSPHDLAATLVFLAAKVEEMPRPLFQIIQHALSERFSSLEELAIKETDVQVVEMRERVLQLEKRCLTLLCFDLVVDNPYRHIQRFFHLFPFEDSTAAEVKKEWRDAALQRMKKSYHSLVHLECSSRLIAGACILGCVPPDHTVPSDWLIRLFKIDNAEPLHRIDKKIEEDLALLQQE